VVEGIGTLCSVESGVQTPSRARSSSPRHGKVEKENPKAPTATANHAFWREGGYGAGALGQGLLKATIDHNMALHGHNSELALWLFCSKFLT
jgi:hypothetical protein